MLKTIARDEVNDVAIIQTCLGYVVRYGLQQTTFASLNDALDDFRDCVGHAMQAAGAEGYAA